MNQEERRQYLIDKLIKEQPRYGNLTVPRSKIDQKRLLRSLMNVRMPGEIDGQFLAVQDEYLKEELADQTKDCQSQEERLKEALETAEAVVIGAGRRPGMRRS